MKERLRFCSQHGRGEALAKALADRVRANPADSARAIAFLDALAYARTGQGPAPDLAWLGDTLRPLPATAASDIATRLATLGDQRTAAVFWRQAVATPLTGEEVRRLEMMCQMVRPEATVRASFAVQTREGLAACLLELGQAAEAQTLMQAAADIRETHHLDRNALFAGRVQGASGQRVIEGRIQAEEPAAGADPQYWRERAQYYRGRDEPTQEEEALRKGLALAPRQPEPERRGKGHTDWRGWRLPGPPDYGRL